ncbi:MAG TPA: tetratricopeptide repeat protein [Devosia sp.]|nr:tetratricopeptide repeat protein [Devosia sp.]
MSNDTLLREVDDELRRDRMRQLWRRSAPFVFGAAVAVILLVAGYEGWNWYTESNASRSSDQFYAAAEAADGEDLAAAEAALNQVIADGSGAYPALAEFRRASLLAQQGKTAEAVAAYDSLSTGQSNPYLREVALVMAGHLLIDGGDVAAVEQRVGGSITPESPMRNAAREVLGLAQYKAGQLDAAMTTFQAILDDPLASADLQSRVQIFVQQLLAEGAAPVVTEVEAPAEPSAEPAASSEPAALSEVSSPAP